MNCQDVRKVCRKLGRHFAGYSWIVGCYSSYIGIAVDIVGNIFGNFVLGFLGSLFAVGHNFVNYNMTDNLMAL